LSGSFVKLIFHLTFCLLVIATALPAQDPIAAAAELERTRQLVAAGALPRAALEEAERASEKARLQQQMRDFVRRDVGMEELGDMLEAAARLRDLAREEFELVRARVEAGAVPAQELEPARESLQSAEKQLALAEQRGKLVRQLAQIASAEERFDELEEEDLAFAFVGEGGFSDEDLLAVDGIFYEFWGQALPISARGDTELHRSMGFDHTGRVDVALHPDDDEGDFLIELLESWGIPFIAFRSAVPGQATGPHIHIGLPSPRLEEAE
jgi:hypothetical protein